MIRWMFFLQGFHPQKNILYYVKEFSGRYQEKTMSNEVSTKYFLNQQGKYFKKTVSLNLNVKTNIMYLWHINQ